MSRALRPYCPGLAFHVTSRITGHATLFEGSVGPTVPYILADCIGRCDTELLAHAIMPNHLHLIIRQGEDPIFRFVQPVLRRIALLVQKRHRIQGHVFERVFRDKRCRTAEHLRKAIVYTHLNPVRKGLCSHPEMSQATSSAHYCGTVLENDPLRGLLKPAIELFASMRDTEPAQWHASYREHVNYRMACDAVAASGGFRPEPPCARGGDLYFEQRFATGFETFDAPQMKRQDLRDIVMTMVSRFAANLPLNALRGKHLHNRELQQLRSSIIREAARRGHSGVAIATFFAISPSRVSEICRQRFTRIGPPPFLNE
jgi:REP element-mobilizing transposase RayT